MKEKPYLRLQSSEETVVHAASRIFSSYIVMGKVTKENEDQLIEDAISIAVKIATKTDIILQSDEEQA
jgi:hypothetical protein